MEQYAWNRMSPFFRRKAFLAFDFKLQEWVSAKRGVSSFLGTLELGGHRNKGNTVTHSIREKMFLCLKRNLVRKMLRYSCDFFLPIGNG